MEAITRPTMSPLRLDRYFLKQLYFGLYEGFDRARIPDEELTIPKLKVDVVSAEQNPDNMLQWRFELALELLEPESGDFPYKIETTVVGYFTVSDALSVERAERLIRINAPALLYSTARDLVASVTGRSPYQALMIPSITFIQPEKVEAKQGVKALPPAKPGRARKATKRASKKTSSKAKKSG